MEYDIRWVYGHVEVYDSAGVFRFSADSEREAREELAGRQLDLLVAGPDAAGWAGAGAVDCRTVLLHGAAGSLARNLRPCCAVSYGTSPRDTLTLSSLEGNHICLALQRELVTLAGEVVERQELVLPFPADASPLPFLAAAGALLLLGLPLS